MRIALAAVVALLLLVPAAARACSCALPGDDPHADVREADAAVWGKVVKRRVINQQTVRLRLRVIEDFKDNLGAFVRVTTGRYSSACGLTARRGDKVGLLLYREGGHYGSGLCSVRTRGFLQRGASPESNPRAAAGACG